MSYFYINHRDHTPEQAVAALTERHDLTGFAQGVINDDLNRLIRNFDRADLFSHLAERGESETAIPYAGWYWRDVDFFERAGVIIARDEKGETVVCQSNKWDHPDRVLTDEERDTFRSRVWLAACENDRGGNLDEIHRETAEALTRAGDFIRGLSVTEAVTS